MRHITLVADSRRAFGAQLGRAMRAEIVDYIADSYSVGICRRWVAENVAQYREYVGCVERYFSDELEELLIAQGEEPPIGEPLPFFEAVKVNDDNAMVRRNRLNLLHRIRSVTGQVADLERIGG